MTLVQRTLLSFAGVLVLTLLACGYVLHGVWRLDLAHAEQRRIARAAGHAHFVDAALLRTILLLEQYVDAPDPAKLTALRALRREAGERRQALRTETNLPRIVALIDEYDAVQPQRAALAEQIVDVAGSDHGTLLALRRQRDVLDQRVRSIVGEIVEIEDRVMADAVRHGEVLGAELRRNVLVLFASIVALTLVAAIGLARGVSRRIVPLMGMARKVSQGDFAARVPVEGRDELATLSATLNQMAGELQELETAKDDFVALASHQLRTPATAVKGNLAMILDGYFGELTAEQREFVQDAYDSNERQMEVIDAILNVARAETGRLQVEKAPVDLAALVDGAISEHRFDIGARGQRLSWERPNVIEVPADATKLRMVVDNLVSNASKYTPEGGSIRVALTEGPDEACIEVEDDGVGIAPEDQARLFRKFSRIDNPLAAVGGTGLGLFLAAEIVHKHGGDITVQSAAGRGSTFRVTLPRR